MRILVVTQYFWPENFRINDLCTELAQRGHDVTVLTGKPNYPDGKVFEEYKNSPTSFSQFKTCDVIRVPMIARGNNTLQLILNYLSFAISASVVGLFKLRKRHYDIIFVFEPSPITVGLPAIFIKMFKKSPIVFWVLDLWPETLEAIGVIKSKSLLTLMGSLSRYIYNRCDLILGQSKAFYDGIARYCTDKTKIKYFPSWSDTLEVGKETQLVADISKYEGFFKILFTGNIGEAQDFPAILEAARILKEQQLKVKFFIVGDGRAFEWVQSEIETQKLNNDVYLLGRHPLESMPTFYASADALLATLQDSPVFAMTIPGKVQSYMAAGKPILTMITGEGSRIINEAACGYTAKSGDGKQLAANVISMSELQQDALIKLGDKAKTYAKSEFDRDTLITQLETWFLQLKQKSENLNVHGKQL